MEISQSFAPLNMQSNDGRVWDAAKKLEASFLAEMLKSAGLGQAPSSFGGGTGETQFASFLQEAQAKTMVEAGGIGLAEAFYYAMKEMENE